MHVCKMKLIYIYIYNGDDSDGIDGDADDGIVGDDDDILGGIVGDYDAIDDDHDLPGLFSP